MNWYGKMNILSSITRGLEWMHESGYIHYNLHVGNILRTGTGETIITDVGIKKPTIKFTSLLRDKCKSCDEMSRNSSTFTPTPLLYVSHPEAVYHSRLLEFDDMPRIINTDRRSKLLNSFPYSESRQIDGQDNLEYQDDQDDHTSSCLCPFNYLLNWLHSLKKLKK
ncbi:51_t:CDS:2 [Funneliformis caledonium]|uniref:51_t:CDS:1 n=2 Tax=Funneliformis TaxID=1117308 RepID=A0A9N8VNA9_9GLOM|nr:51_t:CDS:2 [Funneliformis caledonium]